MVSEPDAVTWTNMGKEWSSLIDLLWSLWKQLWIHFQHYFSHSPSSICTSQHTTKEVFFMLHPHKIKILFINFFKRNISVIYNIEIKKNAIWFQIYLKFDFFFPLHILKLSQPHGVSFMKTRAQESVVESVAYPVMPRQTE